MLLPILLAITLLYALFTLTLWVTWLRIPTVHPPANPAELPFITVIIPVRNEALNLPLLLHDLNQQTYSRFEVIVADDASTDETLALTQAFTGQASFSLRALPLSNIRTASPKKRAITQSIRQAQGDLIVTTDGDCRVGPRWLETIAAFYATTHARLISGPVTFTPERSVADFLQTVEGASLIGSGACTMALGVPTMCNGANLCYEKQVFEEVGGFDGVDHVASGDDELLMHKIAHRYPQGIRFLKSQDAIVQTGAHTSWRAFYNQRKRWASKWQAYQSYLPTVLAVFVFLSNTSLVVSVLGWLANWISAKGFLTVVLLKVVPEFLFLRQVLVFLQKKPAVSRIPLTQLVYPFYVLFFGLAAQRKGFDWKDRKLQ
ncbi:glycosyltransferase [Nibrella saemangeumensis]|uniref:Glycosyltransferase n=1 Tax=Nibrella saemangeumensis TaxID=1084526 RepID=A0ABP8MVB4_9BACT